MTENAKETTYGQITQIIHSQAGKKGKLTMKYNAITKIVLPWMQKEIGIHSVAKIDSISFVKRHLVRIIIIRILVCTE